MNWNSNLIKEAANTQTDNLILNTKVVDAETNEPLIGANIVITDKNGIAIPINGVAIVGRKTDTNGKFILPIAVKNGYIKVSYVGYQELIEPAIKYRNKNVQLKLKYNNPLKKEIVVIHKREKKQEQEKKTITQKPPKPKQKKLPTWAIAIIAIGAVGILGTIIYIIAKK